MKVKVTRFSLLIIAIFALTVPNTIGAYGASKSQLVSAAFETYINRVNLTYEEEMTAAINLYQPQITSTENKIKEAKSKFLISNQVKVVKLGENRNYWGNFNCPTSRPDCIDVDKGPKFQVGEVTTIKSLIADKSEYLDEMEIIFGLGLVELSNPTTYNEASKTIRTEYANLITLNEQYKSAKNLITYKKDSGLEIEIALLAAERAAKTPSIYDKAFVAALKFEQNRIKLNNLASTPWRYLQNYKALSSAIKVTRLSDQADAVADNYSYSRAMSINTSCGTAFTNDSNFKSLFAEIAKTYKLATKSTIKL
jgi:hypothetical protein